MSNTFVLSTIGSAVSSLLYLYVGQVLRRRKVSAEGQLANTMFVVWWQSLGGLGLSGVVLNVAYLLDVLPIWLYQAYVSFVLLVLFVALWGLQFYLVFLYTGSRRSFLPLGAFYAVLFFATAALIAYVGPPDRITDNGWTLKTEPETDFGMAFNLGFLLLIVGPQMFAAVAYARLYRKSADRTQRYRIAMVTSAILVWFGSSVLATAFGASDNVAWQVLSRLIGVAGALAILMAYKPPAWIQQKYGIEPVESVDKPKPIV